MENKKNWLEEHGVLLIQSFVLGLITSFAMCVTGYAWKTEDFDGACYMGGSAAATIAAWAWLVSAHRRKFEKQQEEINQ